MERISRWREPAVVVVVAALLLRLVLAVVFAASSARLGLDGPADSAYLASRQLSEPIVLVVLAVLVASCHLRPATRHARTLTAVALVVAGLCVLLAVVLALTGYRSYSPPFSQLDLAERLVDLVVPLVAVGALAALVQRHRGSADEVPALVTEEELATPAAVEAAAPDPALQPTWQPDAAAGAAWYTAGDAASGRPAAGWGGPESAGGWEPASPLPGKAAEPPEGEAVPDQPAGGERRDWGPPAS
jgi:hypothetical protein